jgi:hypothetical protein
MKILNISMLAIFVLSTIMLAALLGCSTVQNKLTPADVPQPAVKYAYPKAKADANGFVKVPYRKGWFWNSKADLVDAMFNADLEHIKKQADLEYQITLDKSVYSKITQQAIIAKQQADADQQSVFGQNGLLAMALGLLSGSSLAGMFVNWYKSRTMYTDDEIEIAKNQIEKDSLKVNYSEAEYQLGITNAKNEALNTLKLSMYTEDEVKDFKDQIAALLADKTKLLAQVQEYAKQLGLLKVDTQTPEKTLNS